VKPITSSNISLRSYRAARYRCACAQRKRYSLMDIHD
jgi:hypothetical protein